MKLILIPLFFFLHILAFANMANPYRRLSQHTSLFVQKDCEVTSEKILINFAGKAVSPRVSYKVRYNIHVAKEQTVPLLFIANNYVSERKILVNGVPTNILPVEAEKTYPFLSTVRDSIYAEDKGSYRQLPPQYYISYDKDKEYSVDLKDLIYFKAPLKQGENIVEVSYKAYNDKYRMGFLPPSIITYAIYPSKYWSSFPEIEVELHFADDWVFNKTNMDVYQVEGNTLKGRITSLEKEEITWSFTPRIHFFQKVVLWISPFGFGWLAFLFLFILHIYYFTLRRRWGFWAGIFLVPLFFYVVTLGSFSLIDWILGNEVPSTHGYVFLIVVTYPIFVILYGMVMGVIRSVRKSKMKK